VPELLKISTPVRHFLLNHRLVWLGPLNSKKSTSLPADDVSARLLHPPLPALQLKLVFVIERIHDQPQL